MAALIVAGEMVFGLVFHLPRYYRPTLLSVFGMSNADLGDAFALYGILAMLSYIPSGLLADRFSARKLLSLSLFATAAGGLYFATLPGMLGLSILYSYWGVTTIVLFWSALIRATREWGGSSAQGRGFGLLDGGRGLVAALIATAGVIILSLRLGADPTTASDADRALALQAVILFYSLATVLAGIMVWSCIPESNCTLRAREERAWSIKPVLRLKVVWLQGVVVICSYCGYKAFDNYSLYAFDVLGMDEARAAGFAASAGYIRPVAAVAAGYLGDRVGVARMIMGLFAALIVCWTFLGGTDASIQHAVLAYAALLISIACAFGLRSLYFALLEHNGVPRNLTGTAVGLISLSGYTPDIYFGAVAGRILDATPGVGGHQDLFLLLAAVGTLGLAITAALRRRAVRATGAE